MELIKFIRAKHPEKLHRRDILVPLSERFDVPHAKHKNRTSLCQALLEKMTYNTTDPITLEPIDAIPPDDQVAWWQNDKRYVARKTSIRSLIDSGHKMNPWVTDMASGIQNAENPERYDKMYNMTRVQSLMRDIQGAKSFPTSSDDVPDDVKDFFRFENLCDDLYTVKLTTVLQTSPPTLGLKIFLSAVDYTWSYYERDDPLLSDILGHMRQYAMNHARRWLENANILPGIFEFFDFLSSIEPTRTPDVIRAIILRMNDKIR